MLISKRHFITILTQGLSIIPCEPSKASRVYKQAINRNDTTAIEATHDDCNPCLLKIFIYGKEVFQLEFTKDLCVFRSDKSLSDLLSYREEIHKLIVTMVAHENSRALESFSNNFDQINVSKSIDSKNKKYVWN